MSRVIDRVRTWCERYFLGAVGEGSAGGVSRALPQGAGPGPQQIQLEAQVPAHRVAAVTEEINIRIQGILMRAMREDSQPAERSMLVLMGVRGDGVSVPGSSMLH